MLKDLIFALRMVRRAPGFAAVAVLTLGLGIGANTAIFSLIDTIFLHGLPFDRPQDLVVIQGDAKERNITAAPLSISRWEHFRDNQTTLTGLAANTFSAMTLTGQGDPVQLNAIQMSSNFFDLLGVKPVLGRPFRPDEESRGERVVLLSQECWTGRFHSDPGLLGRTITLAGIPHTVIGVMPSQPRALFGTVDVFTTRPEEFPGITPELRARGFSFLFVMGRLKPGFTEAQAQENMNALVESYRQTNAGKADADWQATVVNLQQTVFGGQLRSTLWLLLGAVGFVLLIATSNVANLLLVRFSARRREISLRLSLGANRSRVVRLFLFESLILSAIAALTGLVFARTGLALLVHLNAPLPVNGDVALSWWVLGFTAGVALLSGLAMGLYPSLQAAGTRLVDALKEGGRGNTMSRGQHWFRMTLLGGQVALSSVLLIGAFLMVVSVGRLERVSPAFDPAGVFTAGVNLPASRYPTKVEQATFADRFLDQLRHAPGITHAAFGIGVPLLGFGLQSPYSRADGKFIPYPQRPLAPMRFVTPDYFATLGIRLIEGREFTDHDGLSGPRVTVLSEGAARAIFPEGGALGRHLLVGSLHQGEEAEIVGIATDVRSQNLQQPTPIEIYRPLSQLPGNTAFWQLVVKTTTADPAPATSTVRDVLRHIDADLPLVAPTTMTAAMEQSIGPQRLMMALLALFAGLALLIAVVGIYGVVAYTVNQRRTEIGVRLALGAVPGDVIRLIMRQSMTPVLAGLGLGVGAAAALGQLLESQLFGTTRYDPLSFGVTIGSLLVTGIVACALPSWRASRMPPAAALR